MFKHTLAAAGLALLAGCSGQWGTNYEAAKDPVVTRSWHVHDITVQGPASLTVTEDNGFAPDADIVWHGDPLGDRKAQVSAIVQEGIRRGTRDLRGNVGVDLVVVLDEFHALTPRARSEAPEAVHNIGYTIQVFDDLTGEPLTEPEYIRADLAALTKVAAAEAVFQGQTQKVRITDHIERVTEGWLGIGPDPRQTFSGLGR